MYRFYLNGDSWKVKFVHPRDRVLVDRTGELKVATTDPYKKVIYLSSQLRGDFLIKVLIHELGHCVMISYNLIDELHEMVKPEYWMDAEEWCCNLLADYGIKIFSIIFPKYGFKALDMLPKELGKLIS